MTCHKRLTPIRISAEFSEETLQAKKEWDNIFTVIKENTANHEYYTWKNSPSKVKER